MLDCKEKKGLENQSCDKDSIPLWFIHFYQFEGKIIFYSAELYY